MTKKVVRKQKNAFDGTPQRFDETPLVSIDPGYGGSGDGERSG